MTSWGAGSSSELSPDEFRSETEGSWPRPAVEMLLAAWDAGGGLHLLASLPDGADEGATAEAARSAGVGVHELHHHCTVHRELG